MLNRRNVRLLLGLLALLVGAGPMFQALNEERKPYTIVIDDSAVGELWFWEEWVLK